MFVLDDDLLALSGSGLSRTPPSGERVSTSSARKLAKNGNWQRRHFPWSAEKNENGRTRAKETEIIGEEQPGPIIRADSCIMFYSVLFYTYVFLYLNLKELSRAGHHLQALIECMSRLADEGIFCHHFCLSVSLCADSTLWCCTVGSLHPMHICIGCTCCLYLFLFLFYSDYNCLNLHPGTNEVKWTAVYCISWIISCREAVEELRLGSEAPRPWSSCSLWRWWGLLWPPLSFGGSDPAEPGRCSDEVTTWAASLLSQAQNAKWQLSFNLAPAAQPDFFISPIMFFFLYR